MRFNNVAVSGGIISSTTSAITTIGTDNLLDGVTFHGTDLNVGTRQSEGNSVIAIRNGLTLDNVTVTLGRAGDCEYGLLNFQGTQTLGGVGEIIFTDLWNGSSACNRSDRNGLRVVDAGTTLTVDSGITVSGAQGFVGYSTIHGGTTNVNVINRGRIVSDAPESVLIQARTITNTGIIEQAGRDLTVTGNLINSGEVRPSVSSTGAGALDVNGIYTQTVEGTLTVVINGTTVGTQYSRLAVTGRAFLDGRLVIQKGAGYTLETNTTFTIVTTGGRNGNFQLVDGKQIDSTHSFDPDYTTQSNHILLRVIDPRSNAQADYPLFLPWVHSGAPLAVPAEIIPMLYLPLVQ